MPRVRRRRGAPSSANQSSFGCSWHQRSDLPGIGQRDGIWYALGCNGSGVALMPFLGHKVALQLLARQEGKTAFDDIPFTAVPFYNGTAWFRPLMTWWFRARDALRGR